MMLTMMTKTRTHSTQSHSQAEYWTSIHSFSSSSPPFPFTLNAEHTRVTSHTVNCSVCSTPPYSARSAANPDVHSKPMISTAARLPQKIAEERKATPYKGRSQCTASHRLRHMGLQIPWKSGNCFRLPTFVGTLQLSLCGSKLPLIVIWSEAGLFTDTPLRNSETK